MSPVLCGRPGLGQLGLPVVARKLGQTRISRSAHCPVMQQLCIYSVSWLGRQVAVAWLCHTWLSHTSSCMAHAACLTCCLHHTSCGVHRLRLDLQAHGCTAEVTSGSCTRLLYLTTCIQEGPHSGCCHTVTKRATMPKPTPPEGPMSE